MNRSPGQMNDEISSLALSIKKNVMSPAEKEVEKMAEQVAGLERSLLFLHRAYFAAALIFAVSLGTVIYYLVHH